MVATEMIAVTICMMARMAKNKAVNGVKVYVRVFHVKTPQIHPWFFSQTFSALPLLPPLLCGLCVTGAALL